MALETTQKRDVVGVFLGCTMPVVLRPVGDHFCVVGECYINSGADGGGRLWSGWRWASCQLEEIVLC